MKQRQEPRLLKRKHIHRGPIRHRETGRGLGKSRAMAQAKTNLKRRDSCLLLDPAQEQLQVRTTKRQVGSHRRTHRNRTIAKTHRLERCPRGINAKLQTSCRVCALPLVATFALSLVLRLALLIGTYGHLSVLMQTQRHKMFHIFVALCVRRPKARIIHPAVMRGKCKAGRTSTTGERISRGGLSQSRQDLHH